MQPSPQDPPQITTLTFLERVMDERDRLYDSRFRASETAMQTALVAQKLAVDTALQAVDRAGIKAETAADKRFDGLNELRQMVVDAQAMYMQRLEAIALLKSLEDKVEALQLSTSKEIAGLRESRSAEVGAKTNARDTWGYLVGGMGTLVGIAGFVTAIVFHLAK